MLPIFLANWRSIVIFVTITLCAITVGVSRHQVANTKKDLAILQANYDKLSQSAKFCTDSISELEEREKQLAKTAQDAIKAATDARGSLKRQASILAHSKQSSGGSCENANNLLNDAIRNRL